MPEPKCEENISIVQWLKHKHGGYKIIHLTFTVQILKELSFENT